MQLGRDAIIILSMRILGTLFWLLYTVILARTLPKSDFALVLYVINFSLISIIVITIGLDVALLRHASIAWKNGSRTIIERLRNQCRIVIIFTGIIFTIILYFASLSGLETPITSDPRVAILTGIISLAGAQMGINRDCLRSINLVWQSQLGFNIIRSVVPILGSISFIAFGIDISFVTALIFFLLSLLLSLALEEYYFQSITHEFSEVNNENIQGNLWRSGLLIWPGDIAAAIQIRAAGVIGGLILSPELTAILLAAERMAGLSMFPISAASQAAATRLSRATSDMTVDLQESISKASSIMFFAAVVGCGGAALVSYPGLLALGPEYVAALPIALILIFANFSWSLFGLSQSILNLSGKHRLYSFVSISMAIITVPLIWLMTSKFSIYGAAIGYCICWWLTNIAHTIALRLSSNFKVGIFSFSGLSLRGVLNRLRG